MNAKSMQFCEKKTSIKCFMNNFQKHLQRSYKHSYISAQVYISLVYALYAQCTWYGCFKKILAISKF